MPLRGREEDDTSHIKRKNGRSMRRNEGSADAASAAAMGMKMSENRARVSVLRSSYIGASCPRSPRVAQRDCCRAKSDLRSERCSKPDAQFARDGRNRRTERKKGGREQALRNSQEKRPRGSTRRSKLVHEEGTHPLSRRG